LMLEFYGSMRSAQLLHKDSTVVRFDIWLSR
jgi:hypothetical protein